MFHFLVIKRYRNITNIYKHDGSPIHTKGCCSKQHRNHGTRPDLRKSISGRLEIPSPKSTVATQLARPTVWPRSRFGKWSGPTCSIDKQTNTHTHTHDHVCQELNQQKTSSERETNNGHVVVISCICVGDVTVRTSLPPVRQ